MSNFKPTPNLVLSFACEDAVVNVDRVEGDLQFGWWELKRPMYHVYMPRGVRKGFGVPELCVYYQLSSGHGDYNLIVELHDIDLGVARKTRRLAWSKIIPVHCPSELAVIEDVVALRQVPFPKPGLYQFQIKADGVLLPGGESYLRVFAGEGT